ncbi:MAG: DoxX family membrane protein [Deltaproteobacteria bacterium]|nr:DoxX family membrane protein [Deltaproteobacteria bacterium]
MRRLRYLRHPYVALIFRLALAAVFLWAGIAKAWNPQEFGLEIARYRMVPHNLINVMAITLPWIEIVAGVLLVIGLWARAAALLCTGMMVVFIAAIISALQRGLDISCGCFGGGDQAARLSQATLWRDLLWFLWAAHATLYDRGVLGIDGLLERRRRRAAASAPT